MSNAPRNVITEYSTATGILTGVVRAILLAGADLPNCAKVFVDMVEMEKEMPPSVINLKNEIKQQYDL